MIIAKIEKKFIKYLMKYPHSGLREGVKRTFRCFLGTIQDMTLVESSFEAYYSGEHKKLGLDIGFRVLGGHGPKTILV